MMNSDFITAIIFDCFFAAVASIGFAVISNPPRKAILVSAFLAAVGHGFRYFLLKGTSLDISSASFIAAFIIGMLSILFAKKIHCPAEVFSFPSLLPMIPGMYAYKTVLASVKFIQCEDYPSSINIIVDIFRNGTTTVFVLFALVVGVSVPMFIFHNQTFSVTRILKFVNKDRRILDKPRVEIEQIDER
ncbi:MAG: threonine/serine exporter family protein [Bacteroidales bacterium]|nr:threonine/serine exporter family protein [Bacteroidales bacterium]MDD4821313.1 threonine/serine exporter family protein [Bacteroidales bacterium]